VQELPPETSVRIAPSRSLSFGPGKRSRKFSCMNLLNHVKVRLIIYIYITHTHTHTHTHIHIYIYIYISIPLQYISIIYWLFRSHEFGPVVFTDLSDILCLMAATNLYRTNFKFTVLCFEMEKLFGSFQNGCICTNKLLHLILPNQNITSCTSVIWHTACSYASNLSDTEYVFDVDCIVSCADDPLKKGQFHSLTAH